VPQTRRYPPLEEEGDRLLSSGANGSALFPPTSGSAERQTMSEWDIKGLETNFEGFRKDRYPDLTVSDAFERFAVRQIPEGRA
jgi:hypothetical protein